jgi:hypothetical protein
VHLGRTGLRIFPAHHHVPLQAYILCQGHSQESTNATIIL